METMPDVVERAPSGRAKCRGCGRKIDKAELRFGQAVSNPFGEGETKHWFCLPCAAEKRPEAFLAVLNTDSAEIAEREELTQKAQYVIEHPRLARVTHAERSPTGRARCRHCREPIEKGALRIALEFTEEGMTTAGGFIHVNCAAAYFGGIRWLFARLERTSEKLADEDLAELKAALELPEGGLPA